MLMSERAIELLEETSPPFLVNHCKRSHAWAAGLAAADGVPFDPELLAVAALLHDLGLVYGIEDGKDFEISGGDRASAFVRQHGWDRPRADLVAEIIRLHVAANIALADGHEAYLLWHATGLDVTGHRFGDLPAEFVRTTLADHPRLDFAHGFSCMFAEQARLRPQSRAGELVRGGIIGRIEGSPFEVSDD